jgi:hypothetical protein
MTAEQLAPAFITTGATVVGAPQLFVSTNWPLILMPVIETDALLVLMISTVCGGLVPPTGSVGNVSDEGVTVRAPAPPVVPFPVAVISCGLPAALSEIEIWLVTAPVTVGVNVTLIVHVPPLGVTVVPQLLVSLKGPLAVMPLISSGALPSLIRVTACEVLAMFKVWLPKLTD